MAGATSVSPPALLIPTPSWVFRCGFEGTPALLMQKAPWMSLPGERFRVPKDATTGPAAPRPTDGDRRRTCRKWARPARSKAWTAVEVQGLLPPMKGATPTTQWLEVDLWGSCSGNVLCRVIRRRQPEIMSLLGMRLNCLRLYDLVAQWSELLLSTFEWEVRHLLTQRSHLGGS